MGQEQTKFSLVAINKKWDQAPIKKLLHIGPIIYESDFSGLAIQDCCR